MEKLNEHQAVVEQVYNKLGVVYAPAKQELEDLAKIRGKDRAIVDFYAKYVSNDYDMTAEEILEQMD